ncbi:MAG: hypothetical protein EBS51_15135 [Planctomycetia bacterium]|nr:hypothetical protein [Planctomycetia bacterium]
MHEASSEPPRWLPSPETVLLVNLAATAFMTGLIWYVQVVHYPLMAGWPHDDFGRWEASHRDRTAAVVIPGMLLEGLTAMWLVARPPKGVAPWLLIAGAGAFVAIWASTFFLQVPAHGMLTLGWDEGVHARLVATNWIRTVLWSARLVLVGIAVHALLVRQHAAAP